MAQASRRAFVAAAGAAMLAGVVPGRGACSSWSPKLRNVPLNPLPRPDFSKAKPFTFSERQILPRPLLSQMNSQGDGGQAVICDIYRRLTQNSQNPTDPLGYLHHVWWHGRYCDTRIGWEDIHQSWKFLPWHRLFLYFHERIIRKTLGRENFRLPVWDWECTPLGGLIPKAYQQDPCSPLARERRFRSTLGAAVGQSELQSWLRGSPCFIGQINGSSAPGAFGSVHMDVHEKINGILGDFSIAAADPVFFAHHANVDRYWRYWTTNYGSRCSVVWPSDPLYFYDENRCLRSVVATDLLDETKLGYRYDFTPGPGFDDSRAPFLYEFDTIAGHAAPRPGASLNFPLEGLKDLCRKMINAAKAEIPALDSLSKLFTEHIGPPVLSRASELISGLGNAVTDRVNDAGLPFQFQAKFEKAGGNGYYLLALADPHLHTDGAQSPILGGFGLVADGMDGRAASTVSVSLTLPGLLELTRFGAQNGGDIRLVYGLSDQSGRAITGESYPLGAVGMPQIMYPKNASDFQKLFASKII